MSLKKTLYGILPISLGLLLPACGENNIEPPPPACSDGIDNDGDAFIDAADLGCDSPDDNDELDAQCADGLDNDFDGLADALDPECANNPNAEANLQALPDLRMTDDLNKVFFGGQLIDETISVTANDGEFQAGCFTGTGDRRVIRWNSVIENVGDADLVVIDPSTHQPPYEFVDALGRLEFFGWTRSFLIDQNNQVVAQGHKGSFCMLDLTGVDGGNNPGAFQRCDGDQGISVGAGDIYSAGLECQFIDITGLATNQNFTLRVETNFTRELPEKDYTNNSQDYDVFIP